MIPKPKDIGEISAGLKNWKERPGVSEFKISEARYKEILKHLDNLRPAETHKYLTMGHLKITTKRGNVLRIAIFSEPGESHAVFQFNDTDCYYKGSDVKRMRSALENMK